jgi:hypothetical protein
MAGDESTAWLPLGEASQRLGISVDALRARVRRGLVEHRKDNNRRIVVLVGDQAPPSRSPVGDKSMSSRQLVGDESADRMRQERDEASAEADHWRAQAEQARIEAAGYKAQAEAKEVLITELRELLAAARRPWWQRWIG